MERNVSNRGIHLEIRELHHLRRVYKSRRMDMQLRMQGSSSGYKDEANNA